MAVASPESAAEFELIAETIMINSLAKVSPHEGSAISSEARSCTAATLVANQPNSPYSPASGTRSGDVVVTQSGRILLTIFRPRPATGKIWALGLERPETSPTWDLPDHWLMQDLGHRLEDAITAIHLRQSFYESERRYRTIVETAHEGIFTIDELGKITFANPAMSTMLGRDLASLKSCHFLDLVDVGQREATESRLAARLTGHSGQFECQLTHRNGQHVWVKCASNPLVNKSGKVVGMLGMLTDITARRVAEQRQADYQRALISIDGHAQQLATTIADSESFFRTACASIGQLVNADVTAVALITDDGESVRVVEAVGASAAELQGNSWSLNDYELHRQVIETGASVSVGEVTTNESSRHPYPDQLEFAAAILIPLESDGKVVGTLSAYRHSSAFQRFEQSLLELYGRSVSASYSNMRLLQSLERRVVERTSELHERNTELDDFAHSVSHDLRAPLRAIDGFSAALREDYGDRMDKTGMKYLQHIVDSARRMDTLINDLLAYSRLGRKELRMLPMNLSLVVTEAQQILKSEIVRSGATINVDLPLPPVMGHAATALQIVTNLLSNAMKFVAPGLPSEIHVWAEQRGKAIRLWVEDNGIGIDASKQERIFLTFERLHGVETYPGTGIGLAIVSRGCQRLGGTCGVESTPGKGSRFWIELEARD